LDRFIDDKYSTNDAIRDVLAHWRKLGLLEDAVKASYDDGKIDAYLKEVDGRVGLARVLVSFVEATKTNLRKW
jgi:hypothetical protein